MNDTMLLKYYDEFKYLAVCSIDFTNVYLSYAVNANINSNLLEDNDVIMLPDIVTILIETIIIHNDYPDIDLIDAFLEPVYKYCYSMDISAEDVSKLLTDTPNMIDDIYKTIKNSIGHKYRYLVPKDWAGTKATIVSVNKEQHEHIMNKYLKEL